MIGRADKIPMRLWGFFGIGTSRESIDDRDIVSVLDIGRIWEAF